MTCSVRLCTQVIEQRYALTDSRGKVDATLVKKTVEKVRHHPLLLLLLLLLVLVLLCPRRAATDHVVSGLGLGIAGVVKGSQAAELFSKQLSQGFVILERVDGINAVYPSPTGGPTPVYDEVAQLLKARPVTLRLVEHLSVSDRQWGESHACLLGLGSPVLAAPSQLTDGH